MAEKKRGFHALEERIHQMEEEDHQAEKRAAPEKPVEKESKGGEKPRKA